jgi:hypothetical protein
MCTKPLVACRYQSTACWWLAGGAAAGLQQQSLDSSAGDPSSEWQCPVPVVAPPAPLLLSRERLC